MNTKAPIYRFASLRNPNSEYSSDDIEYVEIETFGSTCTNQSRGKD